MELDGRQRAAAATYVCTYVCSRQGSWRGSFPMSRSGAPSRRRASRVTRGQHHLRVQVVGAHGCDRRSEADIPVRQLRAFQWLACCAMVSVDESRNRAQRRSLVNTCFSILIGLYLPVPSFSGVKQSFRARYERRPEDSRGEKMLPSPLPVSRSLQTCPCFHDVSSSVANSNHRHPIRG